MQLTINLPDSLTTEKIAQLVEKINHLLQQENVTLEGENLIKKEVDPWDDLDFENLAVDTGIKDFAVNHDHYLYGLKKQS